MASSNNLKVIDETGGALTSTKIEQHDRSANIYLIFLPLVFYVLAALRTSGDIAIQKNRDKIDKII